jgi:hypothetical protein
MCCSKDADCAETGKTDARCLPLIDVEENFCGGAVPAGNVCRYDQCADDADCKAQTPTGATVATCLPSGAFGRYNTACVYGGCRTDADCTKHPGGQCQYGLAATNGVCNLNDVLFCAYPSDPCQTGANGTTTGCANGMICVPNADYQGRECGKPPPAYP